MAVEQRTESERILAAREQYVPRGIATPPIVVARAEGARVEDVDGKTYIDFAGGLGCQNTGHGFPPRSPRCTSRSTRYLHQCFMVGIYEPYVEVCRRLAELSPCAGESQKSLLLNSRRRGGRERGQDRPRRDRKPGRHRLRERLPRPDAADDDDDAQGELQAGLRPVRARGLPRAGRRTRTEACPRTTRSTDVVVAARRSTRSPASSSSPSRARAASSRMPDDFPGAAAELCREHGASTSTTRCSPASAAPGRSGRSSTTSVEPDLLVSGKSLGGGLPLAAVTGRAEVMDAPEAGGLGGTFGGNPVACAAAHRGARRGRARRVPRTRSEELGEPRCATRLDEIATRVEQGRRGARHRPDARPRARHRPREQGARCGARQATTEARGSEG